jgi:lipid-A-disaccharide synthase
LSSASLLLVAGEISGDIHGGNLLRELREISDDVGAYGIGGDRLAAAGLECVERSESLAHMGFAEVIRELPRIRGIMRNLVRETERRKPNAAVLIDSPDFNLRLARHLDRLNIPVILYVSPQLWAWRKGRVRTIRRLAREVLCILPFEVDFFREHGVPARFVGHPLVDDLAGESRRDASTDRVKDRLALLPGSRAMEVRSLLPTMIDALRELPESVVQDAILLEAPGVGDEVDRVLERYGGDPRLRRIVGDQRRRELVSSALAWTASGTATLECALLDVPMVVGYKVHALTAVLARMLVRVPNVSLVNLIAGRRIVPELLQSEWRPDHIVECTREILTTGSYDQRAGLADVRKRLGEPGASRRAAQAVAEFLT